MGGLYYDAPHRVTADVGSAKSRKKRGGKNYFCLKILINEQIF